MDRLEQIVKDLNNTELMPYEIADIERIVNSENQDALILASKLGLKNAVKKLLQPIYRTNETTRFRSGEMIRHAEVGGGGFSTIHMPSQSITETETYAYSFDLFRKDALGKSAFDYACLKEDKKLLAEIYKSSSDTRLYSVKYKHRNGREMDGLRYFISELCRTTKYNIPNDAITDIVDELSSVKTLTKNLEPSSFTAFTLLMTKNNSFPTRYIDIFKKLSKEVSQEALDLCFNQSINAIEEGPMLRVGMTIIQQELLKQGANIIGDQLAMLKEKIELTESEGKAHNLKKIYDEMYTIDPNDFNTIVNKPKQVIENYFQKDFQEVLKDYVDKGMVDSEALLKASNCFYDINEPNTPLQESRIGALVSAETDLSIANDLPESIFSSLSEKQIIDIFQNGNIKLSDRDVLAIAGKSFVNTNLPFDQVDKVYKAVVNHQVMGDIEEYKNKINNSKIQHDFANILPYYGIEEIYDDELDNNLNIQLRKKLEEEKAKLSQMQYANNMAQSTLNDEGELKR